MASHLDEQEKNISEEEMAVSESISLPEDKRIWQHRFEERS
jgi:hypothetical protein